MKSSKRKAGRRQWPMAVTMGISLGLGFSGWLGAQPTPPSQPPTLPPVRVEGQPPSTTSPGIPTPENGTGPFGPPGSGEGPAGPPGEAGPGAAGTAPISAGGPFGSTQANGYAAPNSTTGTRVDVPQIEFPGVVDVVPSDLLTDQQVLRTDDILRDIAGAAKEGDPRRPDAFFLRGFEVRNRDFRWNGFVDPTQAPRDYADIDRIEVLKGPASVLYGSGQPAGVVNVITKLPQSDPFHYADVQFDNFGLIRSTIDATGTVGGDNTLLYRFDGSLQNTNNFRDFGFDERAFAAPSFTWLLDEDTSLTFLGEFLRDQERFDTGVIAVNGQLGVVPIRRYLGEVGDNLNFTDYKTALFLNHRFNEDWAGRVGVFATWYSEPFTATAPFASQSNGPFPGFLAPPGFVIREKQIATSLDEQYYSILGEVTGKFATGPFKHQVLVGTELGWFNSPDFNARISDPGLSPLLLNINQPVYGQPTPPLPGFFNSDFSQSRYGFYQQDLVDLTEHWKLLAGVREDIAVTSFARQLSMPIFGFPEGFPYTKTDATYFAATPRVGLVYEPVKDVLSFYGSYSESFDPPPGGNFANVTPLRPETGRGGEAGMKVNLLDKRLSLTADGFYIVKNNVLTQENTLFVTQVGQQRSQGAEVEMVGKLTDQWSIIANYAYVDARILRDDDPALIGNIFRGVPLNSASLWTRYNLIDECCQTLGVGLGMVYVDDRPGDLQNSFILPSYTRWDAGLFYRRNALTASLYFENVFDRQYYIGSVDSLSVFPGAPFTIRGTVGIKF